MNPLSVLSPQYADSARFVALGQGAFVIILSLGILFFYFRKMATLKTLEEKAFFWRTTLLLVSYAGMVIHILCDLHERIGLPGSWRIYSSLILFSIGDFGLLAMVAHMAIRKQLVAAVLTKAERDAEARLANIEKQTAETSVKIEDTHKKVSETNVTVKEIAAAVTNGH